MKTLSLILFLVTGILTGGQGVVLAQTIETGKTLMIVQTPNTDTTQHVYIYKDYDKGEAEIVWPISEKGDVFDLYVLGKIWNETSQKWIDKIYWVDSKVVNAYSPEATIEVVSGDNEWRLGELTGNYVKRTRADKPYKVNVTVSGLLTADPAAPPSAKSVRLDRSGLNYTPGTSTDPLNPAYSAVGPDSKLWTQETFSIAANGVDKRTVNDQLTPSGSTKVCGEERWQVTRLADVVPLIPETVLQNVTVQVWPVATATLEGIKNGDIILDSFPSLNVDLKDLYPDSYTYCKIYKGSDTVGTIIPGSESRFGAWYNKSNPDYANPTLEPQNPPKLIVDLNAAAPTDGTYTITVFTETPFDRVNPEQLATITFEVNRRTAVRGTLSSGN